MVDRKPRKTERMPKTRSVRGAATSPAAPTAPAAPSAPAAKAGAKTIEASGLTCPRCNAPMKEFNHIGVTLDGCTGCGGLFLDAGELEEVLQREFPEAMAAAADFYQTQVVLSGGDVAGSIENAAGRARLGSFFRSLFTRLHNESRAVDAPG